MAPIEIFESEIFLAALRRHVSLDRQDAVRHALRMKLRGADGGGELCPPENRIGLYVTVLGRVGPSGYIRILYQIETERVTLWSMSQARGI
jgi:hypothetical protein